MLTLVSLRVTNAFVHSDSTENVDQWLRHLRDGCQVLTLIVDLGGGKFSWKKTLIDGEFVWDKL
jgi:hypothetical protein